MKRILQIFCLQFLFIAIPVKAYFKVTVVNHSNHIVNEYGLFVTNHGNKHGVIPAVLGKNLLPHKKRKHVFKELLTQTKQDGQNDSLLNIIDKKNSFHLSFNIIQLNSKMDPQVPENGLSKLINLDNLGNGSVKIIIEENNITYSYKEAKRCSICNAKSTKKCSRCKKTKYCTHNCQKRDWEKHKNKCVESPL